MNIENILAVAEKIATLPTLPRDNRWIIPQGPIEEDSFCMSIWSSDGSEEFNGNCGTAACIGGWAENTLGSKNALELTPNQEEALFCPSGEIMPAGKDMTHIDGPWAVRTLRHLAETGEVDWMATYEGEEA